MILRELMVPGTRVEFRTPVLLDEANRRVDINMHGTVEHWDYSERLKSAVVCVRWDKSRAKAEGTQSIDNQFLSAKSGTAETYAYLPSVLRVIKESA